MAAPAAGGSGAALAADARGGSRRALSRLLTAIESRTPVAEEALRALYPVAGGAHVVGVTGPPGGGKSTLVSALVARARAADRPVAVLAIDPSSPVTGGAILGDRIRMNGYAGDRDVFIRSMASRGHLGGLAGTTAESAAVLDACGFGLVFIETVGTGQSEVEVAAIADTTMVVQAPEMGDEIQAMKAGLLEVADLVVVNKSDRPGADRAAMQLRAMLPLGDEASGAGDRPRPKRPEVLLASGLTADGVPELLATLDRIHDSRAAAGPQAARLGRARAQVEGILGDRTRAALWSTHRRAETDALMERVAAHDLDPYAAADQLLDQLRLGGDDGSG
ncbi:MAG: methylmalonyl Co-A mutase-associated GTPase MeaB [Candidatus Limnocylindrales bacterium]